MLRVNTKPRKRNAPRPAEKSALGFLQFVRKRPCAFAFIGDCDGKIEAMHLDFAGGKGIGTKVSDRYAIPCCAAHHRLQHRLGWMTFLREVAATKEELLSGAQALWFKWHGRLAWERKLEAGQ